MSLHSSLFSKIVEWAKTPRERRTSGLFLYGAPGIGKTTLAHAALCAPLDAQATPMPL